MKKQFCFNHASHLKTVCKLSYKSVCLMLISDLADLADFSASCGKCFCTHFNHVTKI